MLAQLRYLVCIPTNASPQLLSRVYHYLILLLIIFTNQSKNDTYDPTSIGIETKYPN